MTVFETGTLMRIFVDETDRYGKTSVFMAIVEELRLNNFAGATVLEGIERSGTRREAHAVFASDFSTNLSVVIEVAETEEKVRSIIPKLREMIPEGLITLETIRMRLVRKQQ